MGRRYSFWGYVALIAVFGALAYVPAIALGEESVLPDYSAYGTCDEFSDSSHTCRKGDPMGVFFTSWKRDVIYEVCVTFPTGRKSCTPDQFARAYERHGHLIPTIEGTTTVVWFVEGTQIGTWTFNVLYKAIVPRFGVSPLVVSGTNRLFGLQVRHVPDDLRVRAWRECPKNCELKLRLISRRNEVRRYRLVGPPSNSTFSFGETLYVQVDAPLKRDHGDLIWGRVYRGKLVRDPGGGPRDTAIHRIGELLCTHPTRTYRAAFDCSF
jgi:hypothetical protein